MSNLDLQVTGIAIPNAEVGITDPAESYKLYSGFLLPSEQFPQSEFSASINYWDFNLPTPKPIQIVTKTEEIRSLEVAWLDPVDNEQAMQEYCELEIRQWDRVGIGLEKEQLSRRATRSPILTASYGGHLVGAISMALLKLDTETNANLPDKYDNLLDHQSLTPNTAVCYSVCVDQTSEFAGTGLALELIKASKDIARRMNLLQVLAYSRTDIFLPHVRFHPELQDLRFSDVANRARAFKEFRAHHSNPDLTDFAHRFGVKHGEDFLERFKLGHLGRLKNPELKLDLDCLRAYFSLEDWANFHPETRGQPNTLTNFMRFYLDYIGDPFLTATHLQLGAKVMRIFSASRPSDIQGGTMNVVVRYSLEKNDSILDIAP